MPDLVCDFCGHTPVRITKDIERAATRSGGSPGVHRHQVNGKSLETFPNPLVVDHAILPCKVRLNLHVSLLHSRNLNLNLDDRLFTLHELASTLTIQKFPELALNATAPLIANREPGPCVSILDSTTPALKETVPSFQIRLFLLSPVVKQAISINAHTHALGDAHYRRPRDSVTDRLRPDERLEPQPSPPGDSSPA